MRNGAKMGSKDSTASEGAYASSGAGVGDTIGVAGFDTTVAAFGLIAVDRFDPLLLLFLLLCLLVDLLLLVAEFGLLVGFRWMLICERAEVGGVGMGRAGVSAPWLLVDDTGEGTGRIVDAVGVEAGFGSFARRTSFGADGRVPVVMQGPDSSGISSADSGAAGISLTGFTESDISSHSRF